MRQFSIGITFIHLFPYGVRQSILIENVYDRDRQIAYLLRLDVTIYAIHCQPWRQFWLRQALQLRRKKSFQVCVFVNTTDYGKLRLIQATDHSVILFPFVQDSEMWSAIYIKKRYDETCHCTRDPFSKRTVAFSRKIVKWSKDYPSLSSVRDIYPFNHEIYGFYHLPIDLFRYEVPHQHFLQYQRRQNPKPTIQID